jgi:hypothetical protein
LYTYAAPSQLVHLCFNICALNYLFSEMSSNAIVAIDTLNDELNRVAEHLLESFDKFEGEVDIFSQQRYEALVEETKACLRKTCIRDEGSN